MSVTVKLALGLALALPLAMTAQAQQACEVIAEQARRSTPAADGAFLFPMQGLDQMPDSIVHFGRQQNRSPSPVDSLRARFRPTPELLKAAMALSGPGNDDGALWDIGQGLHALETEGGTAHCSGFVFFTADSDGRATMIDLPPAARGKDGEMRLCSGVGSEGLVGTVRGEPAFILQEGKDQDFEIGVTLWQDKRWQPECKLSIHFNAAFSIGERFCSGIDCEAAANAGLALARRFDNNPKLQEQEETKLSQSEREALRNMPPFTEKTLPTFGSKTEFHDFGCDEDVVPVTIGGRLYVGRLGHGSIGWRCFDDFVFALYAPKDGGLEPVAGITIDKVRAAPVEATIK